MGLTRITSDGITDGTVLNADINASAAIAGTKISPTFSTDATINTITVGKGANSVASNTVLVEGAIDAAVTGGNNVAIGKNSLTTNTSGGQNISVGLEALKLNTTGSNNTGLGHAALQANTSANNSTAVGRSA